MNGTITATTEKLIEVYDDKDNAMKDEIAALGGQTATGTNVFSGFYDRLNEIREYHRKHPSAQVVDVDEEAETLLKEEPQIEFSGEEAFSRYLDMHELYYQYINSKFGEPIEYSAYLDVFQQLGKISWKLKMTKSYKEYLVNLMEYLLYFLQRTQRLQDLDRLFSKVESDFKEQWKENKVEGWEIESHPPEHPVSTEELMQVGQMLKEALAALGLKSGGTVQQRAERLFLTKHTPLGKLDRKHFTKGSRRLEQNGVAAATNQTEAKIKKLCSILEEVELVLFSFYLLKERIIKIYSKANALSGSYHGADNSAYKRKC